jgi:predicted DNA-binding protein with PD1-like motif
MRTTAVTHGRRLLIVLEPGDDVLPSMAAACARHGIEQGVVATFSGAFRRARLIAGDEAALDPELPLADASEVYYTEGIGSGTVTRDAGGEYAVHIHVALGRKDRGGAAVAGHLLAAETHYVVEIVVDEVLEPALERTPHPGSSGVPILTIADAAG